MNLINSFEGMDSWQCYLLSNVDYYGIISSGTQSVTTEGNQQLDTSTPNKKGEGVSTIITIDYVKILFLLDGGDQVDRLKG